jgi:IS1 family transposase
MMMDQELLLWNWQNYEILPCIIFVAVTGGRTRSLWQDIYEMLKKWNIVAMLNNDMIGNSLSSGTLSNNTKYVCLVRQFRI